MLFQKQVQSYYDADAGESLYFAGATYKTVTEEGRMIHIVGVKQADKNIRVRVDYLSMDPDKKGKEHDTIAFQQVLDPVAFERFINDMAMKVAIEDKTNRLIELSYSSVGIKEFEDIPEDMHHHLFKLFLIFATANKDTSIAYSHLNEILNHIRSNSDGAQLDQLLERYAQGV